MPRKRVVNLRESIEELRELERQYRRKPQVARIRALLILEQEPNLSIEDVAIRIGYAKQTLKRWLKVYREEGIKGLLELPGAASRGLGPDSDVALLKRKLRLGEFSSIEEVIAWGAAQIDTRRSRKNRRRRPISSGVVIEAIPERIARFLGSLPATHSIEMWSAQFRGALQRFLPDIDRISITVNVQCEVLGNSAYEPDISIAQSTTMGAVAVDFVELNPHIGTGPHAARFLENLSRREFPCADYHSPVCREYYCSDHHYVGALIFWRERHKAPMSQETIKTLDLLHPFVAFLMSDFVARYQLAHPMELRFDDVLTEVVQSLNLTVQERRVITVLLLGVSHDEAADILHISINTVRYHLRSIYRKAGTHSQAEFFGKYFTHRYNIGSPRH